MSKNKSNYKDVSRISGTIPQETREKIIAMDQNQKAKLQTKRPQ